MDYYDRNKLNEQVGSQPLTNVAKEYGVSAVALGKVCRKLSVPLPGRGYWAKKAHGHAVHQVPLPRKDKLPNILRSKSDATVAEETTRAVDPDFVAVDALLNQLERVNRDQSKLLPLVESSRRALLKAEADDRQIIRSTVPGILDIRVSKPEVDRAAKILDRLIRIAAEAGAVIELDPQRPETTYFVANGQRVAFALLEKIKQVQLSDVHQKLSWLEQRRARYARTGILALEYQGYGPKSLRKTWRDSEHRKLEALLPEIVIGLLKISIVKRREAEERRIRDEKRQQRDAEIADLQKQIEDEEKRVNSLLDQAERWRTAENIRGLVAVALSSAAPDRMADLQAWATWARAQADRIDPTVPSPPSVIDRKPEIGKWQQEKWRLF